MKIDPKLLMSPQQSLDEARVRSLKEQQNQTSDAQKLEEVAEAFEGIFVKMLLDRMPEEDPEGSGNSDPGDDPEEPERTQSSELKLDQGDPPGWRVPGILGNAGSGGYSKVISLTDFTTRDQQGNHCITTSKSQVEEPAIDLVMNRRLLL